MVYQVNAEGVQSNKQCGADGVPSEFWKTCCFPGSSSCDWILYLFDCIWSKKEVRDSWHLAKVFAIFKKGDQLLCSNFRPISLLSTGYKLFALVLLNRLRAYNIDRYLWPSQFGFKRNARVTDALFMARRHIDDACAKKMANFVY